MKTLRFTTTCAIGAALALTFGASMNEAAAQADTTRREPTRPSAERQRVRKETTGQTTMPSGQPTSPMAPSGETSAMMRRDTVYVGRSDTTVVQCNCAATQAAAGEVLPFRALRERLFGNGLYAL